MAFTATERAQIRNYMGSTALYEDEDTRLESAMDTIGADSDQETYLRGTILAALIRIDAQIQTHECQLAAGNVDELDLDVPRAVMVLRQLGRQWAGRLARILGFPKPRADAFGTARLGSWTTPGLP